MWRTRIVVSFALMACGSEPSPVGKCDDLVDVICDRAVTCLPAIGSHATCVQELQGELPCGSVKAVSASYDRYMDQLATHSCGALFPPDSSGQPTLKLPADCMSVVLARKPGDVVPLSGLASARGWQ